MGVVGEEDNNKDFAIYLIKDSPEVHKYGKGKRSKTKENKTRGVKDDKK